MQFTLEEVSGVEAIARLEEYRLRYPASGRYPFMIGDDEERQRVEESAKWNDQEPETIVQASLAVVVDDWILQRRSELQEDGIELDVLGTWMGEVAEKGSISLHQDILTGKIHPRVWLGLAQIDEPWKLPSVVKYGGWNDCPHPLEHCAFFRHWQAAYGAEITGMSGDVVECAVAKPPRDRDAAIHLAWEQYFYCGDIVEQGCETVSNLAATLLNSPYWYFWWD